MNWTNEQLWERFKANYLEFEGLGLALDTSRMAFPDDYFTKMAPMLDKAAADMRELEAGALANPDEKRRVGHYWLRHPQLAPSPAITEDIESTRLRIKDFARRVHEGTIAGQRGPFENLLLIGIGGSALGPQLVANALGHPATDKLRLFFFDNTDPDGMDKVLANIVTELGKTLCLVISKSGATKETRNGLREAAEAWTKAGLDFPKHAAAITQMDDSSRLFTEAVRDQWLDIFPMWDWVGGRTSVTSAVGLLPAALQGLDIDGLLAGAKASDEITRQARAESNPAARMAAMWYYSGGGRGARDLVVIPYKDRLELLSRYLQQLIMESLGKERDREGRLVNQGLSVFGNKGSTDQHAYVQQLREGLNNFFVTFIEVLRDRRGESIIVGDGATSGDFLEGFYLGTRRALFENGRESITITLREVSPFCLGALIALFERTVGIYASLININAYHQPGVQAGKVAADNVLALQLKIIERLKQSPGRPQTAEQLAAGLQLPGEVETIFKICEHLAANPDRGVSKKSGAVPWEAAYSI